MAIEAEVHHEIVDRCHVIDCMIDEFLRGHVAMDMQMILWCKDAQESLAKVKLRAEQSERYSRETE